MQTVGPYRLLRMLGTCQVGDVWSATDAWNNQVTVAVLNADAGREPGWRSAFAAAANELTQTRWLPTVAADHGADTPWVAAATSDGSAVGQVFIALGMSYQPLVAEPGETSGSGPATSEEPTQLAGVVPPQPEVDSPEPVSGAPVSGSARVPPHLVSAPDDDSTNDVPVDQAPEAGSEPGSDPPTSVVPPVPPSPVPPPPTSSPPGPPVPPPPPPPTSSPPGPPFLGSAPVSGPPVSGPPQTPVSGPPQPPMPPQPAPGMPMPAPAASPYELYADPGEFGRPRRRMWLVLAVVFGVIVLGGGGGTAVFALLPDDSGSQPPPSPPTASAAATPTAPAQAAEPGIEPPLDGEWPADWPTFEDAEATPMSNLAGVGFSFEVPEGWSCTQASHTEEVAHYTCGPGGRNDLLGGDLIVRTCPDPCDAERRVELRRVEEAWGLQWIRDSGYRSWAETEEIDDEPRYGLVLVGYWRSTPEGRIDRQVVLRMTAPVEQADEIRMVGSSVRGAIYELTPG